jgi:hypothetical protein
MGHALHNVYAWQDLRYANGTLEERVKMSDAEFAAIDDEIREIRELFDED